jgi:DNA helicase-2/ATP-dependent DNA helicase PcrA
MVPRFMSHGLNPAQHEAVNTLRGPLLVLAGAGTGKTRVVTYRIAQLIKHGTRPSRILAVTFTNKAAAEMQERAAKLLGKKPPEKPEISTFHSLCVRVLRRHATKLGYPAQFAIYDRGDQESIARAALREIKVPDEALRPGDLINYISRWKTQSIRPEKAASFATTDKEHLASMAYRRYQQALKQAGAVDFDDLLMCTEDLFVRFADARQAEADRFSHLLIDEYQDTNASQYRIVRALAEGHRNLCVVGDDDQSIYGWRGAEVAHILRFKHDWPDAKVVRLEENYRSTEAILTIANRLIKFNSLRHDKVLRPARMGGEKPQILQCPDEENEAETVVADIAARLATGQVHPREFAILFRTNEQPRAFEAELRRAKLPYILVGGMSFFDRKEVRDILAYLKLLVLPTDEVSLRRIINTPARAIGAKAQEALVERAVSEGKPLWDVLPDAERMAGLAAPAVESTLKLRKLLEKFQERLKHDPPVDVVTDLIRSIGYQDEINRLYKEPEDQQARWAAVEEVVNSLGAYQKRAKKPTLAGFLDDVALGDRESEQDKEAQLKRNAIALMTLHSAKGLEFPQVYLVGMEEHLLPHRRSVEAEGAAIDEERRLCYVGITRAQDRLTITLALSRMKWGKARPTVPSRFLFEITGQADSPQARQARLAEAEKRNSRSPRSRGAKLPDRQRTQSSKNAPGRSRKS